jgi:hypothetical protein
MPDTPERPESAENLAEPEAFEKPGGEQHDSAEPLDHRALDDEVSEGRKASEDLLADDADS